MKTLEPTTWTKDIISCPTIVYTLIDVDNGSPDAMFFISGGNLKVLTNLRSKMGNYTLELLAEVKTIYKNYTSHT